MKINTVQTILFGLLREVHDQRANKKVAKRTNVDEVESPTGRDAAKRLDPDISETSNRAKRQID
jgi:hypothetical protein